MRKVGRKETTGTCNCDFTVMGNDKVVVSALLVKVAVSWITSSSKGETY